MPLSKRVLALIVGAPRAGTFSLYQHFSNHPEVATSAMKEPNFFFDGVMNAEGMRRIAEPRSYLRQFSPTPTTRVLLEASPSYLRCRRSPHLIADFARRHHLQVKIIVLMRDPLRRAFSNWLLDCRQGHQTNSFEDAFEADRLRNHAAGPSFIQYEYYRSGLYSADLAVYRAIFGSENVMAQVVDDPVRPLPSVAGMAEAFLQVSHLPAASSPSNPALRPRNALVQRFYDNRLLRRIQRNFLSDQSKEWLRSILFTPDQTRLQDVMSPQTSARLADYFRDDRAALAGQGFAVEHWL